MDKYVTDNPQSNFETMLNMVYGKDGWQYIRTDSENGIATVDFCLMLCKDHGCEVPESIKTGDNIIKDERLCDCTENGCPIAMVYAALCGLGHMRDRLRLYEDADMWPPMKNKDNAAAERHGQWEEYPDSAHLRCSKCKVEFEKLKMPGPSARNYCPNCGVPMDGKKDE